MSAESVNLIAKLLVPVEFVPLRVRTGVASVSVSESMSRRFSYQQGLLQEFITSSCPNPSVSEQVGAADVDRQAWALEHRVLSFAEPCVLSFAG